MRNTISKMLVSSVFCLSLFSGVLYAQEDNDRNNRAISAASSIYVISAKAGGVNFTEGKVSVNRVKGKSGYLIKGDELQVSDKVSTDADGKVEILLNPGSFVRLGGNTEFEFVTTSLDDLQLKIKRGSAVFEVIADRDFRVAVNSPKTDFYLIKSGIYRVDVTADGTSTLEVWKGNAQVGDGKTTILKGGQTATVSDSTAVAKFDRDEKDSLEMWSKSRSKELAKINSQLDRRSLQRTLLNSYGRWSVYDSFGIWLFNARYGSYCFLPFGYGWRSPYGYGFDYDLWSVRLPYYYYQQQNNNNNNTNGTPTNSSVRVPTRTTKDDSQTGSSEVREAGVRVPIFTKVQRDIGDSIPVYSPRGNDSMIPSRGDSFPSRIDSAPSAPSAPIVIPTSPRGKDN